MTLQADLSTLDELPSAVAHLASIRDAAELLADLDYPGADAMACEINLALEALMGMPGAVVFLAGLKHASGDAAKFNAWDAGLAKRMNMGETEGIGYRSR